MKPAFLGGDPIFPELIPFTQPSMPALSDINLELEEIFDTGMITKGEQTIAYEKEVAAYLGVKEAIAVASCTTGLILVAQALGLKGEVLLPSFTFFATAHALYWNRLRPVFVDCEPDTFLLSCERLEESITEETSAILAVHVFGNPVYIEELEELASKYSLRLFFDAAHGFGSSYKGKPLGSSGDAEVFSTSATKLLSTGEGGIVTTNNEQIAKKIRIGREYGHSGDYNCIFPGLNGRLTEFQALLGRKGLKSLNNNVNRRRSIVNLYQERLGYIPGLNFQRINPLGESSYNYLAILVEEDFGLTRDELFYLLSYENIPARKYFYPPLHLQESYKDFSCSRQRLEVTERICSKVLCLPIFSHMQLTMVDKICEAISRIYQYREEIKVKLRKER